MQDFDHAYECFENSRRYLSKMVLNDLISSKSEGLKLQKLIDENMQLYWKLIPKSASNNIEVGNFKIGQKMNLE